MYLLFPVAILAQVILLLASFAHQQKVVMRRQPFLFSTPRARRVLLVLSIHCTTSTMMVISLTPPSSEEF